MTALRPAMLRQASIAEVRAGKISRNIGQIVVAMRRYPRGFRKALLDEYAPDLAPAPELFAAFRAAKKRHGDHNRAFVEIDYLKRFRLSKTGLERLRRLSAMAASRDVFLICQCRGEERCHRDLLLILAREVFGAEAEPPRFPYPSFMPRRALP